MSSAFIYTIMTPNNILKHSSQEEVTNPCISGQLIFSIGAETFQWGKNSLFNKWCWDKWIVPCKRMKLDPYLTPHKKKLTPGNFPVGPVVRNAPCNAGNMGSTLGWGTKIPYVTEQLSPQTITWESVYRNYWAHGPQLENLCVAMKIPHATTKTWLS